MEMLRITTPEGRAYEMPYNKNTVLYYETANARKKATEVKYKIEEFFAGETDGKPEVEQRPESKTPQAQEAPKVPEVQKTPETPEVPETPEAPEGSPDEPQVPKATETQNVKPKK